MTLEQPKTNEQHMTHTNTKTMAEIEKMSDAELLVLAAALEAEADTHEAHASELRRYTSQRGPVRENPGQ